MRTIMQAIMLHSSLKAHIFSLAFGKDKIRQRFVDVLIVSVGHSCDDRYVGKAFYKNVKNFCHFNTLNMGSYASRVYEQIFQFEESYKDINIDDKPQKESFWRPSSHLMCDMLISGYCRNATNIRKVSNDLMDLLSQFVDHCDEWDMNRYLLNRSWKAIKECLSDEYMIRKLIELEADNETENDAVALTNKILEDEVMQSKIQKALPGIHILTSFNGIMLVLVKSSQHTIYGSRLVQTGECHEWTVKIASIWPEQQTECIQIGLIKNDKDVLYKYEYTGYWANQRRKPYDGYLFDGQLMTISPPRNGKYYACEFGKVGDVITMKLKRDKISYTINGVDYGVAFEEIDDAVYRLAVCIVYEGTRVELL